MMQDQGRAQRAQNDLVLSFFAVRRAIGALGFFLPVALIAYGLFAPEGVPRSFSAAFYSPMREIFVGTLFAQAVFLWSYEGYRPRGSEVISDKATARIAAVAVMLVALIPTDPAGLPEYDFAQDCTVAQCWLGLSASKALHVAAAAVFFGALAVYCLVLFQRGHDERTEKVASNHIYTVCGWLIVVSIGTIGLFSAIGWPAWTTGLKPVFWLETVATCAFATSWAVKGDAMRPLVQAVAAIR